MGKMETVPESIIVPCLPICTYFFACFFGGVATLSSQNPKGKHVFFPTKGSGHQRDESQNPNFSLQLNTLMPMPRAFTSIQPVAISSWKMPM